MRKRFLINTWPALESQNFRLFMSGQVISLIGTFMQQVAVLWLIYRLTQSPIALGTAIFVSELTGTLITLLGGLLVDRFDPYRILVITQSLAGVQAATLTVLSLTGHMTFGWLLLLGAFLGAVNGLGMPARQVFVIQLVGRSSVGNAVILSSIALDTARLIGPSLGGVIIATTGEWLCFLLNSVSYVVIVGTLFAMRRNWPPHTIVSGVTLGEALDGIRYAISSPSIRYIILLVAIVSFTGGPYIALLPIMATVVLGGAPDAMGWLMASIGVGSLLGAIFLGRHQDAAANGRYVGTGAAIFGLGLFLFSCSRSISLSVVLLVIVGFGIVILMASSHTTLLTLSEENKRGRVMSLFTLSFMATVPFGSLLAGVLANHFGTSRVIGTGACICLLCALLYRAVCRTVSANESELRPDSP